MIVQVSGRWAPAKLRVAQVEALPTRRSRHRSRRQGEVRPRDDMRLQQQQLLIRAKLDRAYDDRPGGRVERGHHSRSTRGIRRDFCRNRCSKKACTHNEGHASLTDGYKLLIDKDLFGGENGIRTPQDPLDSVTYRFYIARIAVNARDTVAPCPELPAPLGGIVLRKLASPTQSC
jgi:hypothetical protein